MQGLQDVSVKVPAERLAEFYEWFGRWMRESAESNSAATPLTVERRDWDPETDQEIATTAWRSFPPRAQLVLNTLIDSPDRRFTGDELATLNEIPNGKYGLAGTFAWPGRQLRRFGRPLPMEVEQNPRGGSFYWMTPRMARLWARARRAAED